MSYRYALVLPLTLALLLPCLRARDEGSPAFTARDLLMRTQAESDASYTFDQATSATLAATHVPQPPEDARRADLEAALRAAGFGLRPLGTPGRNVYRVERIAGG